MGAHPHVGIGLSLVARLSGLALFRRRSLPYRIITFRGLKRLMHEEAFLLSLTFTFQLPNP